MNRRKFLSIPFVALFVAWFGEKAKADYLIDVKHGPRCEVLRLLRSLRNHAKNVQKSIEKYNATLLRKNLKMGTIIRHRKWMEC